jgi:hypothetical protein
MFVLRLECDRPDCDNTIQIPIGPNDTPRNVVAALGWSLVRLAEADEVVRCPEHPLRAGLIPPTSPAA